MESNIMLNRLTKRTTDKLTNNKHVVEGTKVKAGSIHWIDCLAIG